MIYGSVCSGIEAATAAWHVIPGWHPAWFAEIEKFPCRVLAHHYPDVPNLGDMTKLHTNEVFNERPIDLLVGGTPCQSFSVAGLRKGLADPRGNLALEFLRLADLKRPRWIVWENVPGVLSSGGGRDFGSFLGALAELGYGWAYRILDAQYVRVDGLGRAVPQRRRRVFVVGYLGDWRRAAAVLFERESLHWDTAPRRTAGEGVAPSLAARTRGGGGLGTDAECDGALIPEVAGCLQERDTKGADSDTKPGHLIPVAFNARQDPVVSGDVSQPIGSKDIGHGLSQGMMVRRLTPTECERLQGFPDGYTDVPDAKGKPAADGPRYKALGNSMAVNVMRWIGRRIEMVGNANPQE